MKIKNYCYLYLLLIFLVGGCLPKSIETVDDNFVPYKMTTADFKAETARLKAITERSKTAPNEKAEAYRRLAIIYLSPDNPKQDHKKALEELGNFLSLNSGKLDSYSASDWAKAIELSKEYEQSRQKISRLERKNRKLEKTITTLKGENARLEKTIEQLKNLDLSLEKKRKKLK